MTEPKELSAEELAQIRAHWASPDSEVFSANAQDKAVKPLLSHIAALESKLEESNALVREMADSIERALNYSGNRWGEWGSRAETVGDILDRNRWDDGPITRARQAGVIKESS